ncbi:LysR family transcriptional regulator [Micromonospora sp. DR5-3]|uniref:LysR family transcriptional regulator n=1 Tax=unclassified Micromonospora TaxID=2617518 RepID=UPI0011DA6F9D|nr:MULTISPECIES: LysR family transcriptional regulator [unclassified Micromonospora]MCW3819174.1 LysR family transcriptional regulator [Micromonospora sp. DR5-3]TYC21081.1 LysR family transcriptional regulator [Micromonospora sp. MP36]
MSSLPTVDDLRLVEALARHGSVGAAGREMRISQPAASNRLAALERRIGERLFERDTTGARPTPAGRALAAEAAHVLGHLEAIFDRTRAAARGEVLSVGTFSSLAALLFPALVGLLGDVTLQQVTDHGDRLVEWVGEGSLDAAFVTVANQLRLPATATATPVAGDRLAVLTPPGVRLGTGRRPFAGLDVVAHTYDPSADALHRRLSALGAQPRPAATGETAVRMGRLLDCPVVLPRGLALAYAAPDEQVSAAPVPGRFTLFLVTRRPTPATLATVVDGLADRLGLERAGRT